MRITTFARRVAWIEGKKKQINIAQIMEILKTINRLTGGVLYSIIRVLPLVVLLWSVPVYAETSGSANGGWEHTSNSNYGDGGVANVRVEQTVVENKLGNLNVGIEGGYHGSTNHAPYGSISGWSLLGDLLYYPKVEWKVRPYIFGGLGWSWWNFDADEEITSRNITVDLGDSFAKKVGVGADWPINDRWNLNLEWYYFQSHIPKDAKHSDGSPSAVLGDDNRHGGNTVGQEELCLVAGLKYRV